MSKKEMTADLVLMGILNSLTNDIGLASELYGDDACKINRRFEKSIAEIMLWHNTEKKKFALECVPDKLNDHQGYDEIANGHNMCCEHMLKRIEEGK